MLKTTARNAGNRTSVFARRVGMGLTVASLMFAAACSSDRLTSPGSTAPALAPSANSLLNPISSGVTGVAKHVVNAGLMRLVPLSNDLQVSADIGTAGGTIEIAETGLTLVVPRGAIPSGSLTITVTALAGATVAYEFEPHGTQFAKPVTVRQALDRTLFGKVKFQKNLRGGYFKDVSQVDLNTGVAALDEYFPIVIRRHTASFDITHFSGYMVSMD